MLSEEFGNNYMAYRRSERLKSIVSKPGFHCGLSRTQKGYVIQLIATFCYLIAHKYFVTCTNYEYHNYGPFLTLPLLRLISIHSPHYSILEPSKTVLVKHQVLYTHYKQVISFMYFAVVRFSSADPSGRAV